MKNKILQRTIIALLGICAVVFVPLLTQYIVVYFEPEVKCPSIIGDWASGIAMYIIGLFVLTCFARLIIWIIDGE